MRADSPTDPQIVRTWGRLLVAWVVMPTAVWSLPATAAETPEYAIVVSEATIADPEWADVVSTLEAKHRGLGTCVIRWRDSVQDATQALAKVMPRYACFVARPEEAGRRFVADVHTVGRSLDDDPYGDVLWGILTGFDAANALAIAGTTEPLAVKHVTSGTEIAMDRVVEGEWYSEGQKNRMVRKLVGREPEELRGPDDTTREFVRLLSSNKVDLFVTSGHATERDWQIGFSYRNGALRSANGTVTGVDTAGKSVLVESTNPKLWMPVGNCLAGHIDGRDALALAFMNGCGVRQMIGYTVPTWFGYAGWGCLDYFVEQPGRFTFCEAFHANNHALIHRLEANADPAAKRGLLFDRDVVAFYGDPAWAARMAEGKLQFKQTLTENDGLFTLEVQPLDGARSYAPVNTNGSQRGGRPIVQFLPRRLGAVDIIEGAEWKPVITDTFVLVPLPLETSADAVRVSFRMRSRQATPAADPPARVIRPPTAEQRGAFGLDPAFYTKALVVQDILIATSDRVCDEAIFESAYLFDRLMTSIQLDVAARIRAKKLLCLLIGHDEQTSDLPHFKSDLTGEALDFANWRRRGFLDTIDIDGRKQTVVVFAEEDVLEYPGGMQDESILIHEFGHVVMFQGFDEEQMKRVTACFENARDKGLYTDGYAAQRFERVKGHAPVRLLDALAKSFPDQPRDLLVAALSGGDITVNGKPTTPFIMVDADDKVLIHFGGPKDCYALQNRGEYFAEIFQAWYDTNRTMDHDHNHVHTRAQLKEYDPMGAAFCAEVLGDGDWRFVSPRLRAGTEHLATMDPARSPLVSLLPNIEKARLDHFDGYWSAYWKRLHEKHFPKDKATDEHPTGAP